MRWTVGMVTLSIACWGICLIAGMAVMVLPEGSDRQTACYWLCVFAFVAGLATLLPAFGPS